MSYSKQKFLLSKSDFRKRFSKVALLAFAIFGFSISVGTIGYRFIVNLDWVDAFLNASMILGGMGQIADLTTVSQKLFAALYALFSGVAFLSSMAIFLSPIIHRFLTRFHMDIKSDDDLYE